MRVKDAPKLWIIDPGFGNDSYVEVIYISVADDGLQFIVVARASVDRCAIDSYMVRLLDCILHKRR